MTPQQIRASRAMLNWTQADLAMRSNTAQTTICRIEAGNSKWMRVDTMVAIRAALGEAGIVPIGDDGIMLERRAG